jgi:YesN/AraC family two-component response regulator
MNLLLVDDEIYATKGLLDSIDWSRLNFDEILTANSYAQAINLFMENKINILLCDIEMPYGSGIELVEWVKEHYPDTKCLFLTCHDEFDYAKQAVKLKCLDYILKPVVPEKLLEALKNAVAYISNKQKEKEYQQYGQMYVQNILGSEPEETGSIEKNIEKVQAYIRTHISEPLTVESLAKYVYCPYHGVKTLGLSRNL